MILLIDANILLDVLQKREPYFRDSALVWKLCETQRVTGFVSSLSIANLVYVMRKELTAELVEETIRKLNLIFEFCALTPHDLMRAAELKWVDFEDALQCAAAQRIHADYIITGNVKDFQNSPVPPITPGEFITKIV